MKKLLYLLLLTPIIYLASCSKSNPTPQSQSLEDVIVGTEWCLSNANEDGFLLAEDEKLYITQKCESNYSIGDWLIDGNLIKYRYTENSQEITVLWGEVTEYSATQVKLYEEAGVVNVYIVDSADSWGCTDPLALNYNPAAECNDDSCLFSIPGCMDPIACNYDSTATIDDGSCFWGPCIGDTYQGGIVFYLDGNGGGLIAAPSDQGYVKWGCQASGFISGADGTAIGTGQQNTIDILNGCAESGIAARVCDDLVLGGYSDWFLPSKDELHEIWKNRDEIGYFEPLNAYWSSTQAYLNSIFEPGEQAWRQSFSTDGMSGQNTFYKDWPYYVRAIRAF